MTAVSAPPRSAVVVELVDLEGASARAVLSAALQLFGPQDPVDVLLVLPGVDDPQEEHGLLVQELVLGAVQDPAALPEVLLVGPGELAEHDVLLQVRAAGDVAADARSVVLLSATAQRVWDASAETADGTGPAPAPAPAPAPVPPQREATPDSVAETVRAAQARLERLGAERDRSIVLERVARRDVRRSGELRVGGGRPTVVLLFQHRSYWGAVATLWEALAARPDVETRVVALDSTADGTGASTAAFLREQGVAPHSPEWLMDCLDEVDVLVVDNPYDEMRPAWLSAQHLAARGVRLVGVPYGGNAIAGQLMDTLLWDLPLQRYAWRTYLASATQARLFARHCRAGDDGVRVLGTPKTDRVLRAATSGPTPGAQVLRAKAAGRPLVLWNPHFRIGEGGWSTFDLYLEPLLERFAADPSMVLLLRPHFRLWPDLRAIGGDAAKVERTVRAFVARHENVLLDESPDYLDALTACDAVLSDLSSLATEVLPSGTPVCYLHRADGPGPNEEGALFSAMYRADDWAGVERFLDQVARGEDPQREERLARVAAHSPYADGRAAPRIAEELVTSLLGELALSAPPVPAAPLRVSAVALAADRLRVSVDAPDGTVGELVGGEVQGVVADGVLEVLLRSPQGRALPSGSWPLRLGGRAYALDPAVWQAGERRADDALSSLVLRPDGEDRLTLVVAAPVQPAGAERSYARGRGRSLRPEVVFSAFDGGAGACNPLAVQRELVRRGYDAPLSWVVRDRSLPVPEGARALLLGSPEHYEALGRARWVVDNDAMPAVLHKRPGQVLLQTWHGTPLKRLRWDVDEISPRSREYMAEADRDAGQWDYVVSGSPLTSEVLRRAFRANGTVLETGQPRNDVLLQPGAAQRRAEVRARLGLAEDAVAVLHAPTWRDGMRPRRSGLQLELPRLAAELRAVHGDRAVVLHRDHRFVARAGQRDTGVRDVTRHPDMAELLLAADVLVTDYSSSFFDFALTGRPTVFHQPDLELYRDRLRGFYLDLDELPGPSVRTLSGVVEALADLPALQAAHEARRTAFVARYAPWDDGGAAARVVDAVWG